jgi:hypothetical protein
MASDAQIAANRRNARNSTGPRSTSGKKRASRSALRHGLTKPMSGLAFAREVEALARQIARDPADRYEMVSARQVAETQLELERIQRIKLALIERIAALGRLDPRNPFRTIKDETAWVAQHFLGVTLGSIRPKCALDPLPALPAEEPARTAEAARRALPDLIRLNRYEGRAIARRDRAVRRLLAQRESGNAHSSSE